MDKTVSFHLNFDFVSLMVVQLFSAFLLYF